MRREVPLPIEFEELSGQVHHVRQVGRNEYSSSCPKCGGSIHPDGSFPDRFCMFVKSRATGGALAWCRNCSYKWFPGKGETRREFTAEERAAWAAERLEREHHRKQQAEYAIGLLQKEAAWERYHNNLSGELRQYYYSRGIDDFWIEYWKLGYNPSKVYFRDDVRHTSPALTIPIIEPVTMKVLNVRNRLLAPDDPSDKYRPELKDLPSSLYFTDLDKKPSGKCLVVEGEFKAMSVYLTMDCPEWCVVGIPGKSPDFDIFEPLKDCSLVVLMLDPDAYVRTKRERESAAERLMEFFGVKARWVSTPDKPDDMIMAGSLDQQTLRTMVGQGKRSI